MGRPPSIAVNAPGGGGNGDRHGGGRPGGYGFRLTRWEGRFCRFVGDVKYKNATGDRIPNADLYQMLAYATALDLPGGLLIYAQGEAEAATYCVRHGGRRLETVALDLAGTLEDTLAGVREIARKVAALRDEARNILAAAVGASA